MQGNSLKDLESAFASWRRRKKYAREPVPEELLTQARRAAKKHGLPAVARVTRVERARLLRNAPGGRSGPGGTGTKPRKAKAGAGGVPTFSRLELGALSEPKVRPLAEVETRTGVKLRVYEETPKLLSLLSAACGVGGVR